jgi:P27 family predicted phage terminase small subunit
MAEEVVKKKDGRGGKRPGAGRKPKPVDAIGRKGLSKEELQIRQALESLFKSEKAIKAPDYLDDVAYAKWNEIMLAYSQLEINVLNILDVTQLVLYCQSWSKYKRAYDTWTSAMKSAVVTNSKEQNNQIKQVHKIMDDELANMARLAPDLLLTPTGRAKYGVNSFEASKKEGDDEVAALQKFFERRNNRK